MKTTIQEAVICELDGNEIRKDLSCELQGTVKKNIKGIKVSNSQFLDIESGKTYSIVKDKNGNIERKPEGEYVSFIQNSKDQSTKTKIVALMKMYEYILKSKKKNEEQQEQGKVLKKRNKR